MNVKRLVKRVIAERRETGLLDELVLAMGWERVLLGLSNACVFRAGRADSAGKRGLAGRWRRRARLLHRAMEKVKAGGGGLEAGGEE